MGEYTQVRKNTKNPTLAEAANGYLSDASSVGMARFLDALGAVSDTRIIRADLFNRMRGVLKQHALQSDLTLREAAERYHSEFRYRGRPVGRRRLIGTTLLVKGQEFDHAIVLDAAIAGAQGAVCGADPWGEIIDDHLHHRDTPSRAPKSLQQGRIDYVA